MGYEHSSAANLVASTCVACGRPLQDSVSVEIGMGPDCREKHGYHSRPSPPDWDRALRVFGEDEGAFSRALTSVPGLDSIWDQTVSNEDESAARAIANHLVHWLAVVRQRTRHDQRDASTAQWIAYLATIGFPHLARSVARGFKQRVHAVFVERGERVHDFDTYLVCFRFWEPDLFSALMALPPGSPITLWVPSEKAVRVATTARRALWRAIYLHAPPFTLVFGEKGTRLTPVVQKEA